jgi:hypothetical protein
MLNRSARFCNSRWGLAVLDLGRLAVHLLQQRLRVNEVGGVEPLNQIRDLQTA